jgi:hypothetical protein
VTSAGLSGAIVTVRDDVEVYFGGDQSAGDWFLLAGPTHDKTTQRPLVGDYDDDGYVDVVWYGRGSLADELWYSDPFAAATRQTGPAPGGASAVSGRAARTR